LGFDNFAVKHKTNCVGHLAHMGWIGLVLDKN
jgi:hypothetical protein